MTMTTTAPHPDGTLEHEKSEGTTPRNRGPRARMADLQKAPELGSSLMWKVLTFVLLFYTFTGCQRSNRCRWAPLYTQYDETRGVTRPDRKERRGFSGRNPHQQKEHRKSCKMVCFSTLYVLCALKNDNDPASLLECVIVVNPSRWGQLEFSPPPKRWSFPLQTPSKESP